MPYVNRNIQPKHDHDQTLSQTTTATPNLPARTTATMTTHRRQQQNTLATVSTDDDETIDRSINRGNLFSGQNRTGVTAVGSNGNVVEGSGSGIGIAAPDAATPTLTYSNRNMQSNINSIFIPASTSKYPIKQSTITEDFRERFTKFVEHWTKAFVYLSRK